MLTALPALATGPELLRLDPPGGRRGSAVKLTVRGYGLDSEAKIHSTLPGSFTALSAARGGMRMGRDLLFLVEIAADTPIGLYPVRIETEQGLSNILLFSVGAFPEVTEAEIEAEDGNTNDEAETAEPVDTPVIVNALLEGAERDVYRFQAKAGQRLVFEVEGRRAGSALDPALRVFDGQGRVIARNNDAPGLGVDPRAEVMFEAAGEYFVEVHDARFSEQKQNFYRLKIGDFAYAEAMFPLGWTRGEPVEVELSGGSFDQPVTVRPRSNGLGAEAAFGFVRIPGPPGSLPLPLRLSDGPEALELATAHQGPAPIEPETVLNARIAKPGEKDRYRLPVKPGENWFIELRAADLGTSQLYGVLNLYDGEGNPLAEAGYETGEQNPNAVLARFRPNSQPAAALEIPPGVEELVIEVEDLLDRGGPGFGYRLSARKHPPDFLLTIDSPYINIPQRGSAVVNVTVERRGYWRPLQLSLAGVPDDLMVEGGFVLAESDTRRTVRRFQEGILVITPKPGAERRTLKLDVWGEAVDENGTLIRRRAQASGMVTTVSGRNQRPFVAPWLNLPLPAAVTPELPATLEVLTPRYVRLLAGQSHEVKWAFTSRRGGIAPPEEVSFIGQTGGQFNTTRRKKKDKNAKQGSLMVHTTERTTVTKVDVALSAKVEIDGREETIYSAPIRFEMLEGYRIKPAVEVTSIRPGGTSDLTGTVSREPEFTSSVNLSAQNLPLGVECEAFDLGPQDTEYRLRCRAEESAEPGEYSIELITRATLVGPDNTSVPYRVSPVETRLVVAGSAKPAERASR